MVTELGKITVKEMGFECILGTLPFEREKPQLVLLSFSLWLDFSKAAQYEDLNYSVDYAALSEELQRFIVKSQFFLVETLVVSVAQRILENYPTVFTAEVNITKPMAILGAQGASASIRITRD
jgi:7,8-dihydroneopterin aldolase/epimerase/oxygenase